MRDRETIEIALEASETGHLVLSTLHTIDAAKTVERIIGVFPLADQQSIRTRLSKAFRFIVSQRLLPKKDAQAALPPSKFSSPQCALGNTSKGRKRRQVALGRDARWQHRGHAAF